jgi:hypothetical protein
MSTARIAPRESGSRSNIPVLNTPAPVGRSRSKFTAAELKAIMGMVVDVNPYMAKHGSKMKKWKDVAEGVKQRGFCKTHSDTTIKKKVDMLLAYHEVYLPSPFSTSTNYICPQNPNSPAGAQIALELGESGRITIAALLDRAVYMRDTASKVAEEYKDKTRKVRPSPFFFPFHFLMFEQKLDEDAEGGEAIRRASMLSLGRRRRSPSESTDLSDSENINPNSSVKRRPAKRARRQLSLGGMQNELSEMKDIFAKSISAQAKYQEEVAGHLKASNEAYLASQRLIANILQEKL